ncbi:MAG: class I SAM-dependent methyltransferase [bacterium]
MQLKAQNNSILCDSQKFEKLAKTKTYEYIKCIKCGLIFTNPLPIMEEDEMNKFYEKSFYSTCKDMNKFNKHNFNLLYPVYEKQFNIFNRYLKGNNILDFGCGVGYFLFARGKKGFNCLGIEISKEAAKYTQNQLGVKVLTSEKEAEALPSDYFDGVRIAHVLEHLSNPVATLNKINRILKRNGILEIRIPNPYCLLTHLTNLYHRITGNYKTNKYSCTVCVSISYLCVSV